MSAKIFLVNKLAISLSTATWGICAADMSPLTIAHILDKTIFRGEIVYRKYCFFIAVVRSENVIQFSVRIFRSQKHY